MIDTPESDNNEPQSDSDLAKAGPLAPEPPQATQPDDKQKKPKQDRKYTKYVMRPLKAVGRGIVAVVNWTDTKDGFVTALATVIIAVLTGVYVHYSRAQWKVMRDQLGEITRQYPELKKSAEGAKSAAETAASQLELEERPWIDANIAIDGPFDFDVNGANVHLKFTLRNTGHSPAQAINIYPLLLIGGKIANATVYRDQACKESTRISTTMPQFGMVMFPNVPFEQKYSFGVGKEEIEQEKASKQFPGSKFGEVILSPTVVVCLAYRSTFNRTSIYHTAYIVNLFKRTPVGLSPVFKIGENVDPKRLFLRLNVMSAVSAD